MDNKKNPFASVDELFSTEAERADDQREKVVQLKLSELSDFKDHPFHVLDDEQMDKTVESVKEFGVLVPILVRPIENGYEIVSGHRRRRASELAGLDTIPAIVRDMTDDEAIIVMVDSNLQREQILPSEKAFAYKMKMEAIKRQGARHDLTLSQLGTKLGVRADQLIAEQAGESRNQVQRYIRLTNLHPDLLTNVDERHIGLSPAVELSYLTEEQQLMVLSAMEYSQVPPSLKQAKRIKRFAQEGKLTEESLEAIMTEEKAEKEVVKLPYKDVMDIVGRYLKTDDPASEIMDILTKWAKSRARQQDKGR